MDFAGLATGVAARYFARCMFDMVERRGLKWMVLQPSNHEDVLADARAGARFEMRRSPEWSGGEAADGGEV